MEKRFQSFREFWPFYLKEHSSPLNRKFHFVGTSLVFLILFYTLYTQDWIYLAAMPVFGYAFAWAGHFIIEKNRPATFTYPAWSLRGDFKMFFLMLFGKLDQELENLKSAKTFQ